MSNLTDTRPPEWPTKFLAAVPTTLPIYLRDEAGDPVVATTVQIHVGGPVDATLPLTDADSVVDCTSDDEATGDWETDPITLAAGNTLLRLVVDGALTARGIAEVSTVGSISPTSEVTVRSVGLVVTIGAPGITGTGAADVSVEDDGSEIVASVATLNFTGAGVTVTDAGSGQVDIAISSGGGVSDWGDIGGTLSDQTDLQAALDAKATTAALTAHTGNTSNPHSVTAAQAGADPAGTASAAVTAHAGATDPHGDRAYTDAEIAAITPGDIGAATAAQGTLADSAVQPGDLGAVATSNDYGDLDNLPTLGTAAATASTDYATAAQGATADTAVQPGDLSTVATTGAYSDLSGTPTLGTAAAEDVEAFDAAGTGASEAASAIAYASAAGTHGLAQERASAWWTSYLSRATSAVDVVLVGDSITHQDSFGDTMGWGMHLAPLLNGKPINFRQPAGWRHAQAGVPYNPGATTQAGTASATTPNGYGVTMTNGQKATYVVADPTDGISLVYSTFSGAGSIIVRDGVGGTVLATINTDGATNDGNVWTSASITSTARTYEIESSGNTKWAGVYLHDGNRATGVRCWCSGKAGWTTADADTQRTLDLIGTLTPELVVLSTGTNDTDAATYDTNIRSLLANVQGVHAGPVAIVAPYVSNTSTTAKATAARALAAEEGLILIDQARLLGDKAIESSPWVGVGVHPSGDGARGLAHHMASMLRGDPLSDLVRQSPPTMKQIIGANPAASTTITPGAMAMAASGQTVNFTSGGFTFQSDTSFGRVAAEVMGWGSLLSMFLGAPDGVLFAGHRQVVNAQTGTAYTVANADKAKTIIRNNGGASTQDWPQDSAATSLAIGTIIRTFNRGAGAVTHQAGTGATVLVTGTQGQHTWWTAQKIAANTWAVGPG